MTICKFKDFIINEMGRTKKEASVLVQGFDEIVQEHVWKIYAYGKTNQEHIRQWKQSVVKFVKRFRRFNVSKRKNSLNFNREELESIFVETLFGHIGDLNVLQSEFSDDYGTFDVSEVDVVNLQNTMKEFVSLLLDNSSNPNDFKIEFRQTI